MQVPSTIISIDYSKAELEAIKTTPGQPEERKKLLTGEKGVGVCTWDNGQTYTSDVPNLLITSKAEAKVTPRKVKGKAKGKAKATQAQGKCFNYKSIGEVW